MDESGEKAGGLDRDTEVGEGAGPIPQSAIECLGDCRLN